MIVTEYYKTRSDGVILNRTYSSDGFMIKKDNTDELYDVAIDPVETGRTYTETGIPIESEEIEATIEDYQNALAEFGVEL